MEEEEEEEEEEGGLGQPSSGARYFWSPLSLSLSASAENLSQ